MGGAGGPIMVVPVPMRLSFRMHTQTLEVNARRYAWPREPLVAVCVDGCEYDYLERAAASGAAPFIARLLASGSAFKAAAVVPTFTNPNNLSIVTGAPPSVHGIC